MRTITIDINNSIYDHIMFFLKSLPSNLINIRSDRQQEENPKVSNEESLRGAFQEYADPNKQALEKEAWQNHIVDKYKSSLND